MGRPGVLFVVVLWAAPVSLLFKVTVALGTAAPLGSVTVPVTLPEMRDCAEDVGASREPTRIRVAARDKQTRDNFIKKTLLELRTVDAGGSAGDADARSFGPTEEHRQLSLSGANDHESLFGGIQSKKRAEAGLGERR